VKVTSCWRLTIFCQQYEAKALGLRVGLCLN
jgi:hypothetical protein